MGAVGSVDTQRHGGVTTPTLWTPRPPEASLAGWSYGSLKQHPVTWTGERKGMGVPLGCRPPPAAICVMGLPETTPRETKPAALLLPGRLLAGVSAWFLLRGVWAKCHFEGCARRRKGAVSSAVILPSGFSHGSPAAS